MTTRTTFKRVATAAAIAASTVAGTLGISAMNAGSAAAAVDNGRYTLTSVVYGVFPVSQPVTVRGNVMYGNGGARRWIPTPNGAYADAPGGRYVLIKRGPNYYGRSYLGAVPVGDLKLIRR